MTRSAVRLPAGVGLASVLAVGMLVIPLIAVVVRTPWSEAASTLADPAVVDALRLSVVTSLVAAAIATVLGVPFGWLLARRDFFGRSLLRAVAVLPMVLPPVVGGVALLLAYGRRGLVGGALAEATGITVPFSTAAVVLAQVFVALPFVVVIVEAGIAALDPRFEDAAATLGAGRWTTLRRVTLPMILPSLGAGVALGWARALGEFGATITFAGNLPGRTQTLPLAVFLALETRPDAAYVMSLLLLAVSLAVLIVLRGRLLPGRT